MMQTRGEPTSLQELAGKIRLNQLDREERRREQERENAKKNNNFTQLNNAYGWKAMRTITRENQTAFEVFTFLGEHMDKSNAVMCSMSVLQEFTGKGRTTVSNAVKYLKENGVLSVLKSGNSNVYVLNPDLIWKAANTAKPYCEFEGKVLVSKKENEETLRAMFDTKRYSE
ncbi:TPA: replication/maintenance protein RepL, partial [Vibrio parahaemolyticus]|nr:replication/maintenance protein RepL [Vibrio parahaemolyticus]